MRTHEFDPDPLDRLRCELCGLSIVHLCHRGIDPEPREELPELDINYPPNFRALMQDSGRRDPKGT